MLRLWKLVLDQELYITGLVTVVSQVTCIGLGFGHRGGGVGEHKKLSQQLSLFRSCPGGTRNKARDSTAMILR